MRNEYILDVVDKILNLNDIHANRKKLFKVLFSSLKITYFSIISSLKILGIVKY